MDVGSRQWLDGLSALVAVLGSRAFEARLLALLNAVTPVDHCVVFTWAEGDGAGHLFTHGRMDPARAGELARDYVERWHALDPQFARLLQAGQMDEAARVPLAADTDYDPAYRNHFFNRNDLVDKALTIGRVESGSVYCNFYRMGSSGPWSADDWARLERVLPLMTGLISAHYALLQARGDGADTPGSGRSLVHTIIGRAVPPFDRLTRREREVCERTVLGYTAVGIGLDLDIAPSSVATYRRRAYEKLDIHSQHELFALCLAAAGGGQVDHRDSTPAGKAG